MGFETSQDMGWFNMADILVKKSNSPVVIKKKELEYSYKKTIQSITIELNKGA